MKLRYEFRLREIEREAPLWLLLFLPGVGWILWIIFKILGIELKRRWYVIEKRKLVVVKGKVVCKSPTWHEVRTTDNEKLAYMWIDIYRGEL